VGTVRAPGRPLRIAVVAACPLPHSRGTPVRVLRTAEALAARGHEVHVVTYHLGTSPAPEALRFHRIPTVPTYRRYAPGPSVQKLTLIDALLARELWRVLRAHEIDVIHAHHYEGLLVASTVAARTGHPVVYDAHTLLESELPFYPLPAPKSALRGAGRWLDRLLPRRAAHIIVVTDSIRTSMVRAGIAPERITVVPNGVEGLVLIDAADDGRSGDEPTLIFTGNLAPYQRIDLLLRVFAELRGRGHAVRLQIVTESAFDAYEAMAESLGVRAHIDVVQAGFEAVPAHLARAAVALNPRTACDGIPMKLLNYMAAARPIVSFAGAAGYLTHGETALLAPDDDVPAFADAVASVLRDPALAQRLGSRARELVRRSYTWDASAEQIEAVFTHLLAARAPQPATRIAERRSMPSEAAFAGGRFARVSVVIPARNEAATIGALVRRVRAQQAPCDEIEVLVVDDASTDATAEVAEAAGARVLRLDGAGGNPAAARNRGAAASTGDPIVFLDADCTPAAGWLAALLAAHLRGETIVGGALDLPPGLSYTARCDYYCGWYLSHSRRPDGRAPALPAPNVSVRRDAVLATSRFREEPPFSYCNEELFWQAELRHAGHALFFEPRAVVYHRNRPGFINLLRRNYRWGYTAIEAKAQTGSARMAWLYRYPRALVVGAVPLALAHTAYILGCWLRAGVREPVAMLPAVLASRFAYTAGMAVGGVQWLRRARHGATAVAPRWK
jgi:glycosyltransferase involved in cell wall biosynthesis/GT2 family glycosyltransferase